MHPVSVRVAVPEDPVSKSNPPPKPSASPPVSPRLKPFCMVTPETETEALVAVSPRHGSPVDPAGGLLGLQKAGVMSWLNEKTLSTLLQAEVFGIGVGGPGQVKAAIQVATELVPAWMIVEAAPAPTMFIELFTSRFPLLPVKSWGTLGRVSV